jgi:hypothetical protein
LSGIGEPQRPSETGDLAAPMRAALAQLLKARQYARDLGCPHWEFAVEIDRLTGLGATTSDLRWLVKKGYLEHAYEVTQPGDPSRRFQTAQNLAFAEGSCFCLTDPALSSLEGEGSDPEASDSGSNSVAEAPAEAVLLPRWDAEDRTLYLGRRVVKEYRVPSPNQEAVLAAFQEEGWPHYVDDPLSPVGDQSPKQRLRDTIRCLNANQANNLIRFRGDGTGERIRWELVDGRT